MRNTPRGAESEKVDLCIFRMRRDIYYRATFLDVDIYVYIRQCPSSSRCRIDMLAVSEPVPPSRSIPPRFPIQSVKTPRQKVIRIYFTLKGVGFSSAAWLTRLGSVRDH